MTFDTSKRFAGVSNNIHLPPEAQAAMKHLTREERIWADILWSPDTFYADSMNPPTEIRAARALLVRLAQTREALAKDRAKLEAVVMVTEDAGCNLPLPSGELCGECGNCCTKAILGGSR